MRGNLQGSLFLAVGEPGPALKVTDRCLTFTHKSFLLWGSNLHPALFSMVLFSFPLLTGPLAASVGVIHAPFVLKQKMPLNWGFLSYGGVCYPDRFSLLGFVSQVEVLWASIWHTSSSNSFITCPDFVCLSLAESAELVGLILSACLLSWVSVCNPMDCSPPGSSVHEILQARILEWVAMPSSRGSSWPRDWTCVSFVPALAGGFFTTAATWEARVNPALWLTSKWPDLILLPSGSDHAGWWDAWQVSLTCLVQSPSSGYLFSLAGCSRVMTIQIQVLFTNSLNQLK